MKIAKYALALCIASVGLTSVAQNDAQKEKCKEKRAHVMDALDLTDEQRAEMEVLREDMKTKRATLKADESLDEASRKEEFKAMKSEHKKAMKQILTEDQQAKLSELKAAHKANRKDMTPGEVAMKQTEKMKEVIDDLTPEQEEQLHALNLKVANKIDAIKKDETMSEEKKKEFIKGNKEDKRRMLESILTEAQLAQWDAHISDKKKLKMGMKKKTESPKSE
ncbi:MAG: Spy/CpxP family protein refolding chaperone [Fluviicola sp.]